MLRALSLFCSQQLVDVEAQQRCAERHDEYENRDEDNGH
jgi:hypothetical protein